MRLIDTEAATDNRSGPGPWVLDEGTRRAGMVGVEAARAALAGAGGFGREPPLRSAAGRRRPEQRSVVGL